MKKLFFLLLLITVSSSAEAQLNDSLPWFKLDLMVIQLEDRIGNITDGQLKAMQASINPIVRRAKGKDLTQQQHTRLRQEVRKAIVAELTTAQLNKLKAIRKDSGDALDHLLIGKKVTRKRRQ